MRLRLLFPALAALLAGCDRQNGTPATTASPDLVILNGRIWTGDRDRPWAEAIAVRGDSVLAIGPKDSVRALVAPDARVIDATGGMVTPGFIDNHVHFLDGGYTLASVQLRDAGTREEFIRRIAAFAKTLPKGVWIRNGDWDQTLWGGEMPHHSWIDSVTPDNPVWINRLDGHSLFANAAAMRAARVDRTTKDVEGGAILRDANGDPTGIFKDNAASLIEPVVPPRSAEEFNRALDAAMTYVAARGVTSVHQMGGASLNYSGAWEELPLLRRARAEGRLRTRIVFQVPLSNWQRLQSDVQANGTGDAWLRTGGLKGFADGSLGAHTAAMLDGFTDAPNDSGFFVTAPESLYAWVKGADAAGLQVAVHAIGDRAIRTQLDIFERVARENGPRDRRFRIEHAQHIAPADIPRFAALGVIPSMQPYHAVDDGRWADKVIGTTRARGTYAFRSLLDAKAALAFGSDWFVAPPTPLEGIKAAVTRQTIDGKQPGGWVPEQKITVEEALRAYTTGSAYAGFQEKRLGMLRRGMLADLVVLDRDLTTVDAAAIDQTKVRLTVVGGRIVHELK